MSKTSTAEHNSKSQEKAAFDNCVLAINSNVVNNDTASKFSLVEWMQYLECEGHPCDEMLNYTRQIFKQSEGDEEFHNLLEFIRTSNSKPNGFDLLSEYLKNNNPESRAIYKEIKSISTINNS